MFGSALFVGNAEAYDCSVGVDDCGVCGPGCTWERNGEALTITGSGDNARMDGYNTNFSNIPTPNSDHVGNSSVTTSAPWGGMHITSVSITGTLKNIGKIAFGYMSDVTDLTITAPITDIELGAFHMSGLTDVVIPDTVKNIGESAFQRTSGLTSLLIEGTPNIDPRAFSDIGGYWDPDVGEVVYVDTKIYCLQNIDCTNKGQNENVSVTSYEKAGGIYRTKDSEGNYTYFDSATSMLGGVSCDECEKDYAHAALELARVSSANYNASEVSGVLKEGHDNKFTIYFK